MKKTKITTIYKYDKKVLDSLLIVLISPIFAAIYRLYTCAPSLPKNKIGCETISPLDNMKNCIFIIRPNVRRRRRKKVV